MTHLALHKQHIAIGCWNHDTFYTTQTFCTTQTTQSHQVLEPWRIQHFTNNTWPPGIGTVTHAALHKQHTWPLGVGTVVTHEVLTEQMAAACSDTVTCGTEQTNRTNGHQLMELWHIWSSFEGQWSTSTWHNRPKPVIQHFRIWKTALKTHEKRYDRTKQKKERKNNLTKLRKAGLQPS